MILSAKFALLSPGELLEDVRIEVDGGRIVSVSSGYRPWQLMPDYDFGDAVITPGFVNPHAHLELEFCRGKVKYKGDFAAWLQEVRDLKAAHEGSVTLAPLDSACELLAAGCTTLLDHHTAALDFTAIRDVGLRYFAFHEFFGFNEHSPDTEAMQQQAQDSYAPHGPYTVSLELARACRELADEKGLPISVHLSEFEDEISFIRDGRSESVIALLKQASQYEEGYAGTGKSPVQLYAEAGILTPKTYAIHVNYLADGDLEALAGSGATVVYCPRSHVYFEHKAHPLMQLLEAGVPVALGTDSLASNARLSPLYEAALVRDSFPQLTPEQLFAMLTNAGLGPIGWQGWLGKTEPGYFADLAVFPVRAGVMSDFASVFDAVIDGGQSVMTMQGGKIMHEMQLADMH